MSSETVSTCLLGVLVSLACGTEHAPYNRPDSLNDNQRLNSGDSFASAKPCAEGETRECVITLGEHEGILSCFHGYQVCEKSRFGSCLGESISEMNAPPRTKSSTLLFASSTISESCDNNPCDPFCQEYAIVPDEPLVAKSLGPGFSWQTGATDDENISSSLLAIVPCMSGSDCQANQRCENVATNSNSAHSKCETGLALVAGSDECVASICETSPECCQRGWSCAHDICEVGAKLSLSCDDDNSSGSSCVAAVCAADPTCCATEWDGNCVALAASECGADCGTCGLNEIPSEDGSSCYYLNDTATDWEAARQLCRNHRDGWDLVSVGTVEENSFVHGLIGTEDIWLGHSCNVSSGSCNSPGPWSSVNALDTYAPWRSGEPNESGSNACARMRDNGNNTAWYDKPCGDSYESVCEGPPTAGGTDPAWEQACVDLVAASCDATCSTESPPSELGQCVSWRPGTTDPASPDQPDLALGIPCGDGTVPVCNHGGVAAPIGLTVEYYEASSNQYPSCSPNPAQRKGTCEATTVEIPPGECVSVECPSSGSNALDSDDTLVVNPGGLVSEYSCLDNWTIFSDGVECGDPSCAGTTSEATFKPVRMLILVDRSFSMVGARWEGAKDALTNFFESADSAGIGVAIDYFPIRASVAAGDGCAGGSSTRTPFGSSACNPTPCGNPMVELGFLTADPSPLDSQEQLLVNSFGGNPTAFSTPSLPALTGALQWATDKQAAQPDETFVVVFVTDGTPSTCLVSGDVFGRPTPRTNAALVSLAGSVYNSTGVRTYTLGLDGSDIGVLDNIAAAGGTTEAFVVDSSNAATVASEFTAALIEISRQGVSCSFPVEGPEEANLSSSEVVYTSGSNATVLTHLADASDCDSGSGWYFDDNDDPQEVSLCPSTCTLVQDDALAQVSVDVPCAALLDPAVFTERYQATCDDSQSPLWQFLHYSTTVPEDGSVEFKVRTANNEAELATAEFQLASTATESVPICTPGSAAGCPVDLVNLFDASGVGGTTDDFLELEITVNPGSNGQTPNVSTWQVTYSCLFDE